MSNVAQTAQARVLSGLIATAGSWFDDEPFEIGYPSSAAARYVPRPLQTTVSRTTSKAPRPTFCHTISPSSLSGSTQSAVTTSLTVGRATCGAPLRGQTALTVSSDAITRAYADTLAIWSIPAVVSHVARKSAIGLIVPIHSLLGIGARPIGYCAISLAGRASGFTT